MKTRIRTALFWTAVYITIVWGLLPAGASWYWARFSLIRFDPRISKDYNCIFVEGHSARSFSVPWLSRSTPIQYFRLRYTPTDDEPYGIMFIDPHTLAYQAFNGFASVPGRLQNRLDSPQPILDWMQSQRHSTTTPSHTNDAREIYEAVCTLASCDLEHFMLPTNRPLQNFVIGHQNLAARNGPDLAGLWVLLIMWLPTFASYFGNNRETENGGAT